MEDIIDIIVTETTNLIEITSQPTDEIIDVNIIDNREDVTLNVTPTVVEININSLTGNFGVNWGDIAGTLSDQTDLQNVLDLKADLVDGKVPSSQLPSYVDDVVEVANYAALPVTGEVGKIYVVLDTNLIYRWSGSAYIEIKDSSAVWGAITGTLSNQTDLQNALNAKDAVLTFSSPLSRSINTVSIPAATTSVNGYLTSTDWNTFNGKQAQLNGTGFVKISGTTISYDNSTYLTTSVAASTYLPLSGGSISGLLTVSTLNGLVYADATGQLGTTQGTTDTIAYWSSARTVASLATTTYPSLTELSYVKGVTSAIQTQLNSKQNALTNPVTGTGTSGIVAVFNGTSSITDSTIYANSTRVSIGADVTTTNRFTAVSSTTSAYAVVAQASSAANGIWSNVLGTGEIFRGQTAGGSYFIINNGGNAFLNGNLNVGDFASTSYRLNVVGTANFTGALSGTSATFVSTSATNNAARYNISIGDNSAVAAGNGGGILFRGVYTGTTLVDAAGISSFKANGTDGDYGYGLSFITRANGGDLTSRLTIASTGAATFSSSVTANGFYANAGNSARFYRGANDYYWGINNDSNNYLNFGTFAANGTAYGTNPKLILLDNGNVGIGTTSPITYQNYRYLQIDGGSTTQGGVVRLRTSDGSYVNEFAVDSGGGYISSSAAFQIYVNNSPRLYINTSGNVGIGTTSPSGRLHILNASGSGQPALELQQLNSGSNILQWKGSSGSYLGIISDAGNVGIGTTSPANILHVSNTTASTQLRVELSNTANNYNTDILFRSVYGGSTAKAYLIGSNINIANGSWEIYDATASVTRLAITNGGNVLIGTTTDTSSKLTVSGSSYLGTNATLNNSFNSSSGQLGFTVSQEFGGTSFAINLASLLPNYTFSSRAISVILQVLAASDSVNGTSVLYNCFRGSGGTWLVNTISTSQTGSTGVSGVSASGTTITVTFNTTAFGVARATVLNRQ